MFTINKYYKIKEKKEYPWPSRLSDNGKILLFPSDVLTKNEDGTFTKHTGLCCTSILIPEEDLIFTEKPVNLRFIR
ncbi:MAG: hypothetical protein PHW73_08895 [Atribacterota bacterium]|jgi:hypothetical protein|nr:hypothetical protein [Atribacterota bacterium]